MHEAIVFLIVWLGSCALVGGVVVIGSNFDRIAAFAIDLGDLPLCITAQMVSEIRNNPRAEWEASAYTIRHPVLGEIRTIRCHERRADHGEKFGEWDRSPIETTNIFNAIVWRQRQCIRGLLREEMRREARPRNHDERGSNTQKS